MRLSTLNYDIPYSDLKVLGLQESQDLLNKEPNKWNVVSLWSEYYDRDTGHMIEEIPNMSKAKSFIQTFMHDAEHDYNGVVLCDTNHIKDILEYSRKVQNEPLLVHCFAGLSRSTAIAIIILMDAIKDKTEVPLKDAISIVHAVRPQLLPNNHILNLGVSLITNSREQEVIWWRDLYDSSIIKKIIGGV